jgi:cytochrome c
MLYDFKIINIMDSFEINKIVASILLIALLFIGIGKISDLVFHIDKPETPGYKVEVAEKSATLQISETKTETIEEVDISSLLALGDIKHGEKVFKKCAACHVIEKGGANKIGPALYGVLGRKVAAIGDYKYSQALEDYGKLWTFEEMNGYLRKPQSWIKGTKMSFAGLRKEKDRASVILYLNKYSDSPLQLP